MANYCDPTDLPNYMQASVIALASPAQQLQACADATEEANSYLRGRYALPLAAWGSDVRKYTAWIACYLLATMIGYRPTVGSNSAITDRYYMAVGHPERPGSGWFPGVQRQAIHPDVTPAQPQPGDPVHDVPQVRSSPQRGWQESRRGKPVVS